MQERSIFMEALDFGDPLEREAHLLRACDGDERLRARVKALLRRHQSAGGFALDQAPEVDLSATVDRAPLLEEPGTTIGPYKLLEPIGEGGMGVVYVAEQARPVRRRVALKVIKPGMDTRQVLARFEAERQALALMDHPNIAKVHDAGATASGRPYFVMELVKGIPITDYCDRARLSIAERLDLFVLVCRAVQHAHLKGIIHRDLKPSNILVTVIDGAAVPKVIDFGIAKSTGGALTDGTVYTGFSQLIGTPLYMSPEQAELSGVDVDTRSDVYALGVLLYELLTGTTPLDRETLGKAAYDEVRRIVREQETPTPSTRLGTLGVALASVTANRQSDARKLGHAVRGELDWIVMKALEKDRTRRYETANDFAADVMRHLTDQPVEACPPSARYRFLKFARRNKAGMLTATSMALGVVIAFVALIVSTAVIARERTDAVAARDEARSLQGVADRQRKIAEDLETLARGAKAEAERRELATRRYLYAAHMNLAQQAVQVPDPARAVRLLNLHRPGPGQQDLRSFEWYYWWGQSHRGLIRTLDRHTDAVFSAAFSPDGQTLASVSVDRSVKLWDVASGLERVSLMGHRDHIFCVAFSPDGKTVASGGRDRTVRLWDVATSTARATLEGHTKWVLSVAFSPDGRTVASAGEDGTIRLWDVATGRPRRTLQGGGDAFRCLAYSPDGKRIASGSRREMNVGGGELRVWDLEAGTAEDLFTADGAYPTSVTFSPDGTSLAAAIYAVGGRGEVRLWEAATGKPKARLEGHGVGLNAVAFSPDGKTLAWGGEDRSVHVWDLETGEARASLAGHGHFVSAVAFSPDRRTLASASYDRTVKMWDLAGADPETTLRGHAEQVQAVAFSRDGRTVASASPDQIKLWDVASGDLRITIKGHTGPVTSLSFSPDGTTLASASLDRTVKLWDAADGKLKITLEGRGIISGLLEVSPVAFSPDGKTVATASQAFAIRLWDADTGALRGELKGHASPVLCLAFSPDGKALASVGSWDHTARLWDVASGEARFTLRSQGRYIWPFLTASFSPDGKTLATGGDLATVELWDVATGKPKATLRGHAAAVWSLSFCPDGKTLASASYDGTIKIWDPATGEPRTTLRPGGRAIAFSPDGTILASSQSDGVRLWHAATEMEVQARDR